MKIQLIRHATIIITVSDKRILVDPILNRAGSTEPIPNVPNQNYNPLVELPVNIDSIINCDAVVVTHTHMDHFDEAAAELLPKNMPIFCQTEDEQKLKSFGFTDVYPVNTKYTWRGITLNRTDGKHGHGEIAKAMAPVSGFVISAAKEPLVYIAGDTVWCKEVKESMEKYKPEIVVCNCGAAQFEYGKPITMGAEDIHELCSRYSDIQVVAVHMESWNHCRLSRKALKEYIRNAEIKTNIFIPDDGEVLSF